MIPKQAAEAPIAQALRLLRERENVKQTEAGRWAGGRPDHRTISHWETGRKLPSLRLLLRYLDVLGLDLHDLQAAFDQIAGGSDKMASRFTEIERRIDVLERVLRTPKPSTHRAETCEPSKETSTES